MSRENKRLAAKLAATCRFQSAPGSMSRENRTPTMAST